MVQVSDEKTFSDVKTAIDGAAADSTVYLNGTTYKGDSAISISKDITLVGSSDGGDELSTFDGQGKTQILSIGTGITVTIKNIKFINGNSTSLGGSIFAGANSRVTIENSVFENNTATNGGCIYALGDVVISDSEFITNFATAEGGVIYGGSNANVIVLGSNFMANSAKNGGAIYSKGLLNVFGSDLAFNSGEKGGAISADSPNVTVSNCNFTGNLATVNNGGGIYVSGNTISNVKISASSFISNKAKYGSGGAISYESLSFKVSGSNFTDNIADSYGGAIYGKALANVSTSSFIENSAYKGGAIYTESVIADGCEFIKNKADVRSAIYVNEGSLSNCLFEDNKKSGSEGIVASIANTSVVNSNLDEMSPGSGTWVESKKNSTVTLNVAVEGSSATIMATPSEGATGTVTFVVNEENKGSIDITDGIAKLVLDDLASGNYIVNVTYNGDENYRTSNATGSFFIKKSSNITYSFVNNSIIVVEVSNATGNVSIRIDNALEYNSTLTNSTASFNVSDAGKGLHNLTIAYGGDDTYRANATEGKFIIKDDAVIGFSKDGSSNLTVVVSPSSVSGNVTVTIGDRSVTLALANGSVSVPVGDLEAGSYNVTAVYEGDEYYYPASNRTSFIVKANVTSLNVSVVDGNVSVVVDPSSVSGNVSVTIGDRSVTLALVNGSVSVSVGDLAAGSYNVTAVYEGDDYYNPATNRTSFIVKANVTEINVTIDNQTVTVSLDGNITDNMTVDINNTSYVVIFVNGTGKLPLALDAGKYNVTVIYDGNEYYNGFNKTVECEYFDISIVMDNLSMYYQNGSALVVTVKKGDVPVSNATVQFMINGIAYNRTTNESGVARYVVKLPVGNYNVTASYDNRTANATVTVLSTISSEDLVLYYNNGSKFNAEFLDSHGNPAAEGNASFNVNGLIYDRKIVNGTTSGLNIRLCVGNYIITVENKANNESKSFNITVLPLIIANDLVKYFQNGSQFELTLLNKTGAPTAGTVTLNINGVLYTRNTGADGKAVLNINLDVGNYILTAYYGDFVQSYTIIVKPLIEAKNVEVAAGDKVSFTGKALNKDGSAAIGVNVVMNIDGVFYNATTNSEGVFDLPLDLPKGSYIITSYLTESDFATSNTITVL